MPETYLINICIETISSIMLMIILIGAFNEIKLRDSGYRYFFTFTLALFLAVLVDIPTWFMITEPENELTIKVLFSVSYVCSNVAVVCYTYYMVTCLNEKVFISYGNCKFIAVLAAVAGVIAVATTIFGNAYEFPGDGTFIYNDYGGLLTALQLVPLPCNLILLWNIRRVISKSEMMNWVILPLVPTVAAIFEQVLQGSAAYISFSIAALIIYIHQHLNTAMKMVEKDAQLAESRMKVLLSQMQPHFMYNSLNSIYYLVDQDKEKAKQAINDFSMYLRGNISSLNNDGLIEFSKELEHIRNYVALEKIRFEEDLDVVYEIETDNFKVPPLAVQTLVENAIKHGICKKDDSGVVKITTTELKNYYEITIWDNGAGMNIEEYEKSLAEGKAGIGLVSAKERIETLMSGKFELHSMIGLGTEVKIRIPKDLKKNI